MFSAEYRLPHCARLLAGLFCAWLQVQSAAVSAQSPATRKSPATTPVQPNAEAKPSDFVDTLRGSNSSAQYSRGSTYPAVAVPFGFNLWTPVTQPDSTSWLYKYEDTAIQGFSVSHAPNPRFGDYASMQLVPSVGNVVWPAGARGQRFSHAREIAKPHYYRVDLDSGIRVEITPTMHAAAMRITYPARGPNNLLFDVVDKATGAITADVAQGSVSGHITLRGPKLHFFARLDAPIQPVSSPTEHGRGRGRRPNAAISFSKDAPRTVTLRIATSYLSMEQARAHLDEELATLSFDELKDRAQAHWDSYLGRVAIEGATDMQRVTFYSNMYRTLLFPSSMTEMVGGVEKHWNPFSNNVRRGVLYVNHGFWEGYRAVWPLYFLLLPKQAGTMLEGFLNAYRAGGWLPNWSAPGYRDARVGTPADNVFADAYAKGVRNFDVNTAYAAVLKDATVAPNRAGVGREGMARGLFRNYIPIEDSSESAAWHLENCVSDFNISRLAQALGDESSAQYLKLRSLNYAALFVPALGFFRGRRADGQFRTPDEAFRPEEWGYEFGEGCAWHYVAAANHDPGGMASLYGDAKAFADKLDATLSASPDFRNGSYKEATHEMLEARDGFGQYSHGSEPAQHMLYMYAYAGQPWQTQKLVRKVLAELYNSAAAGGGYVGDEDNGQQSAWYVFSALGFYPASPGHDSYAIGSPLFARTTVALENGKRFEVIAHDNSPDHVYIQRATLNGQALDVPYLTHAEITNGGTLELHMGESPSTWGSSAIAQPLSSSSEALKDGVLSDCAEGGSASASTEYVEDGEGARAAFDNDSRSKWLANDSVVWWLRYQSKNPCAAHFYTLTSANDEAARDPKEWVLEGSNDGNTWVALDQRQNENFLYRHQTRAFKVQRPAAVQNYRLRVTANHGDADVQIAEVEFLRVRGESEPALPAAADQSQPAAHEESLFSRLTAGLGCSAVATRGAETSKPLVLFGFLWLGFRLRRARRY